MNRQQKFEIDRMVFSIRKAIDDLDYMFTYLEGLVSGIDKSEGNNEADI